MQYLKLKYLAHLAFGGAVVMPEASIEIAHQRAERLREGARSLEPKLGSKSLGALSVSIGVAAFPRHGNDFAAINAAADRALFRAKTAGATGR